MFPDLRQCLQMALGLGLACLFIACAAPPPTPTPPKPTQIASVPAPIPTPTHVATAMLALACPNEAEGEYFDALGATMRSIGAQLGLLGDDFAKVEQNPLLFASDLWAEGIVGYIKGVGRTTDTILEDLDAPPTVALIHEESEKMARTLKTNMYLMEEGIVNADMDALVVSAFSMDDVRSSARYIRFLIDSFCG